MGVWRTLLGLDSFREPDVIHREEPEPLEGTRMDLFNSIIPNWYASQLNPSLVGTPDLIDRVWVANRCVKLNAQQIAAMPLEFHSDFPDVQEPAWLSAPDGNVFPNGIGDAIHAIVDSIYRYGFACLWVTQRYSTGLPRNWTLLDSSLMSIRWHEGAREYTYADTILNPANILQIDRDPSVKAHGTSALSAYAQTAWGLLAAQNQSMSVSTGGIPQMVLRPTTGVTEEQAQTIQTSWMTATAARNGAPPVLGPDLNFEQISFNPSDMALLETQEWNARVLATAFGVPAVVLNMSLQGGLTYQNPMALMQMWWLTELRTVATQIGNAFSSQMLPKGQWISFDASDITTELNADSASDDEQAAPRSAKATPNQNGTLTAIGGTA